MARPLDAELLRRTGILANVNQDPLHACRRAERLVEQGSYAQARDLLLGHLHHGDVAVQARVQSLLGACASAGAGGRWREHYEAALHGFEQAGHQLDGARVLLATGREQIRAGEFVQGDATLKRAWGLFLAMGARADAARADAARAQGYIKAGRLRRGIERLEEIIDVLAVTRAHRAESRARLDLSLAYAQQGHKTKASTQLLRAECLTASSANPADRFCVQLVRAEGLVVLGFAQRARQGLDLLAQRVGDIEDLEMQARLYWILGIVNSDLDGVAARRHFSRARHLYARLGHSHQLARCEIGLMHIESKLGINVEARLRRLEKARWQHWPLVDAEARLLAAALTSDRARGRSDVVFVQQWASDEGFRRLWLRAEALLEQLSTLQPEILGDTVIQRPGLQAALL